MEPRNGVCPTDPGIRPSSTRSVGLGPLSCELATLSRTRFNTESSEGSTTGRLASSGSPGFSSSDPSVVSIIRLMEASISSMLGSCAALDCAMTHPVNCRIYRLQDAALGTVRIILPSLGHSVGQENPASRISVSGAQSCDVRERPNWPACSTNGAGAPRKHLPHAGFLMAPGQRPSTVRSPNHLSFTAS